LDQDLVKVALFPGIAKVKANSRKNIPIGAKSNRNANAVCDV